MHHYGLKHNARGGFTLIEVTIALMLLSMVLVFVYQSFVMSVDTKQRVEAQAETLRAARVTLLRMEREIQSAYLDSQLAEGQQVTGTSASNQGLRTAFIGVEGEAEGFPRDRLDFTTFSHAVVAALGENDRQSDHEEIAYFTETDFREDRTDLLYRQDFTLDDDPTGGGDIFPLLEGIKGLNFRYLDPKRKEWATTWDSRQSRILPAAVEIELWLEHPSDPKDEVYFSKVVRLPLFTPDALGDIQPQQQVGQTQNGQPVGRRQAAERLLNAFGGEPEVAPDGARIWRRR